MTSQDGFKPMQENVQAALVTTVKATNRIAAEDLSFQRTVDPDIGEDLDEKTERILALSSKLINAAAGATGQDKVPSLEDADDVDMHWRKIVDVVDSVLEKADRAMDEFTGVLKRKDGPADLAPQPKKPKTSTTLAYNMRNANIAKPQAQFEHAVDNRSPWKPVLTKKPHAKLPLEQSLSSSSPDAGSTEYKHPYETEILQAKYPDRVYEHAPPIPYQPIDSTTATWVDSYEGILEMLKELKEAKEIAVDLEHHDLRSYSGLLSLMQISTRDKDWIVDTLKPWRRQLEVLNEVFADPSIIKVFHGAYMDMQWLQRDLGLYVNGLFDTFFACEALAYPQRNLAFLLKRFADFDADKKYQMADWRIRPLPDEMFYYARSDTHYLLYIFDMIRNELVAASDRTRPETDHIERVLQKSKELSLSRYEGSTYNTETGHGTRGWYNLLLKQPMPLSGQQFAVYRSIWKWRDDTARKMDESTGYVMPNATVADIARHMPPDAKALHALIPGNSFIAKKKVEEIWEVFSAARAQGIQEKSLFQFFQDDAAAAGTGGANKKTQQSSGLLLRSQKEDQGAAESGRLDRSQLFGDVPISSMWEAKQGQGEKEYVLLPWQRLIQQTNANGVSVSAPDVEMADANATKASEDAAAAKKTQKEEREASPDREFTLKAGVKRKAAQEDAEEDDTSSSEESDDGSGEDEDDEDEDQEDGGADVSATAPRGPSDAEDEIEIEPDEDVAQKGKRDREAAKRQRQAERKKAKKEAAGKKKGAEEEEVSLRGSAAASEDLYADADKAEKDRREMEKKQKKAAREAKRNSKKEQKKKGGGGENAEPFDYAKATSVLHAKRDGQGQTGPKGKKFDPYSKTAEEGVKAARKMPPLHGTRSATFKK